MEFNDKSQDLDETRRLLYMALLVPRTEYYELAGTLVNALRHHGLASESAGEIMDHLVGYLEDPEGNHEVQGGGLSRSQDWLKQQVERISALLDG